MKISCTNCERTIPAEDIALDKGWAKCRQCDEVFPLATLLPNYAAAAAPEAGARERPFDARVVLQREPQMLALHLPAYGIGPASLGLLGFATFWLAFIAFWTAGALGVFFNQGQIRWENAMFAAFSTPFWLVGFGMLGGAVWIFRGTRSVMLDAWRMVTETRCLLFRRTRSIVRDQVQCARVGQYVANKNRETQPQPAVDIVYTKGVFRVPCVNEAEQAWLVAEINGFLQSVPYDPHAAERLVDEAWPAARVRQYDADR